MLNEKAWLIYTAFMCFLCICIGAFAAHVLESRLDAKYVEIINTGVKYHMFSCVSLFCLIIIQRVFSLSLQSVLILQALGCVCFCFSLYLYAITQFTPFVFVTPVGGILFLLSWALAIIHFARADLSKNSII